jgi:PAS domain-containing protein
MLPFDDILETLQQGITLLDSDLRIKFFNARASEILAGHGGAIHKGMVADALLVPSAPIRAFKRGTQAAPSPT